MSGAMLWNFGSNRPIKYSGATYYLYCFTACNPSSFRIYQKIYLENYNMLHFSALIRELFCTFPRVLTNYVGCLVHIIAINIHDGFQRRHILQHRSFTSNFLLPSAHHIYVSPHHVVLRLKTGRHEDRENIFPHLRMWCFRCGWSFFFF